MKADLALATARPVQALDITDRITDQIWPDGFLWIGCPHTTAAILIGESDPEMLEDIERVAAELFAPYEPFKHHKNDNPNAAAHLVSSFVGSQVLLPVQEGRLLLGTYQRIVFLELDGPKPVRTVRLASVPVAASVVGR